MQILVTGAGGLIGRSVLMLLVERGHHVVALDRDFARGRSLVPAEIRDQVRWVEADTRDQAALEQALEGTRRVIHLAAGPSFLMYEEEPIQQTSNAIQGFHNLVEASSKRAIDSIVYASTSAVYEGNDLPYREDMTVKPPDLKAFAKKVNEDLAELYSCRYGIRMLGMRPFSVYGDSEMSKGRYANVVSLFAWALAAGRQPVVWGDGNQTRDFVFVEDVARAFVLATESSLRTQVLNVGTGVETTFNEIIAMLAHDLNVRSSPIYTDVPIAIYARRLLADTSRCQELLAFKPEVSLEDGAARVIEAARRALRSDQWHGLDVAQEASIASLV